MASQRSFFEKEVADLLMNPACFPPEMVEFLSQERRMLDTFRTSIDLLIEVGCHNGISLDWAIAHGKRYIGIDIASKCISFGREFLAKNNLCGEEYQFILGEAGELDSLLSRESLQSFRCLIFFPFNIFGLIPDIIPVLTALNHLDIPFMISSYPTTDYSTSCRYKYYQQCGYTQLRTTLSQNGVYFSCQEGLYTIAYHTDYLLAVCRAHGLSVAPVQWSNMNMAYVTEPLQELLLPVVPELNR